LLELGRTEEARTDLSRAAQEQPHHPAARSAYVLARDPEDREARRELDALLPR
jgi:hypothetical protein